MAWAARPPRPTKSKMSLGRGPAGLGRPGQPRPPKSKTSFGRGPAGPRRPGPPRLPKSSTSLGLGPAGLARPGPPRTPEIKDVVWSGSGWPGPPGTAKTPKIEDVAWPGLAWAARGRPDSRNRRRCLVGVRLAWPPGDAQTPKIENVARSGSSLQMSTQFGDRRGRTGPTDSPARVRTRTPASCHDVVVFLTFGPNPPSHHVFLTHFSASAVNSEWIGPCFGQKHPPTQLSAWEAVFVSPPNRKPNLPASHDAGVYNMGLIIQK